VGGLGSTCHSLCRQSSEAIETLVEVRNVIKSGVIKGDLLAEFNAAVATVRRRESALGEAIESLRRCLVEAGDPVGTLSPLSLSRARM
jgi:hypothetical protein